MFSRWFQEGLADRVARRGERLCVQLHPALRNAWSWLEPMGVEVYNAFVRRHNSAVETPHSFTFKLRRDLSAEEIVLVGGAGVAVALRDILENPVDVFCVVKTFMADRQLQQAPLLVIPAARAAFPATVPTDVVSRTAVSDKRRAELLSFALVLHKPSYGLHRAAMYIHGLATQPPSFGGDQLPPLLWFAAPSQPRNLLLHNGNPHYQHLPDAPWQLKAKFRRTG